MSKSASSQDTFGETRRHTTFPGEDLSGAPADHHNHPDSQHQLSLADPRAAQELPRLDTTRDEIQGHPNCKLPEMQQVENKSLLPSLEPQTFCTRSHQSYVAFQSSLPEGRHLLTHQVPSQTQGRMICGLRPHWTRAQGQQEGWRLHKEAHPDRRRLCPFRKQSSIQPLPQTLP